MPMVGNRSFRTKKAAESYAKKSGKKVTMPRRGTRAAAASKARSKRGKAK